MKLGELCEFKAGSAFPQAEQGQPRGDYPFIKVGDMNHLENAWIIRHANNWVSVETATALKARTQPKGSVVFAKIGEALKANRFRILNRPTIIDNNMMAAIPKSGIDESYLFYLLRSLNLANWAEGSALPYLKQKTLAAIRVEIPETLPEQKASVATLLVIDKEIDNLNRTNRHLRELLKLEFARRYEDGTRSTVKLSTAVSIWKKSVKPSEEPDKVWEHYSIPAFDAGGYPTFELGREIKSGKYTVIHNSVLVSKLNPTIQRLWIPQLLDGDSAICSTEFMEYVPDDSGAYSFYCSALMQDRFFGFLGAHVTGSTGSRQRVHPGDTLDYEVPNPGAGEIRDYCVFADPIIKQLRNCSVEAKRLERLRDALLPKLMSGEIDVSKVELLVE